MRLIVTAKPKSGKNLVVADPQDFSRLTVYTTQPPDKGKANEAILKLIANHLDVAPSRLTLVSGQTAKTKIVDIAEGG